MNHRKCYKMTAFSHMAEGGNPAGVCIDADGLSDKEMQAIAQEIGFSETAFVCKSDKADFKVRFFTPTDEVALCGHATIATFTPLRQLGIIKPGEYKQETLAGILDVIVDTDTVMMQQQKPIFGTEIAWAELQSCFGATLGQTIESAHHPTPIQLKPQIVSTGLRDILLPVKDFETLCHLQPNFVAIKTISERYDVVGIHAFTLMPQQKKSYAATRNFAPRFGIDEEAATGTSNGALAAFLSSKGMC